MNSICQFPPEDQGGNLNETRLQKSMGKLYGWGKKVLDWLHFCQMGAGHSESFEGAGVSRWSMPEHSKYEALWWDRQVRLDGPYCGHAFDKDLALEAATGYAESVSIGSLTALRRFLETSLRKTDRQYMYVEAFISRLIVPEGRDHVRQRVIRALNCKNIDLLKSVRATNSLPPDWIDRLVKVLMGATRQRRLLVSPWADDDKLWTPGQKGMMVPFAQ